MSNRDRHGHPERAKRPLPLLPKYIRTRRQSRPSLLHIQGAISPGSSQEDRARASLSLSFSLSISLSFSLSISLSLSLSLSPSFFLSLSHSFSLSLYLILSLSFSLSLTLSHTHTHSFSLSLSLSLSLSTLSRPFARGPGPGRHVLHLQPRPHLLASAGRPASRPPASSAGRRRQGRAGTRQRRASGLVLPSATPPPPPPPRADSGRGGDSPTRKAFQARRVLPAARRRARVFGAGVRGGHWSNTAGRPGQGSLCQAFLRIASGSEGLAAASGPRRPARGAAITIMMA